MNLVKFIFFAAIFSIVLGAFGRYPFGNSAVSLNITDLLLGLDIFIYLIWVVISKSKVNFPPISKYLAIFLSICLISLVYSLTSLDVRELLPGFLYFLRFLIYFGVVVIIHNLFLSKVLTLNQLSNFMIFTGVILALFGFIQLIVYPNLDMLTEFGFDPHQGRLVSSLLDPNYTGVFLVITLGLLLSKVKEKFGWVNIILSLVAGLALLLTYSRSAYLMLGVFLLIFGFKWKKLFLVMIVGLLLATTFSSRFRERIGGALKIDASASERLYSWHNAVEVFSQNPVIGVGFNNLRRVQDRLNLFKVTAVDGGRSGGGVDSGFLFVMATTGVSGLLSYIYLWFVILKEKRKENYLIFCILIALLVNGQFINSLFLPSLMLWYLSWLPSDTSLH